MEKNKLLTIKDIKLLIMSNIKGIIEIVKFIDNLWFIKIDITVTNPLKAKEILESIGFENILVNPCSRIILASFKNAHKKTLYGKRSKG